MAKEIERKYLVDSVNDSFIAMATDSEEICQGYLCAQTEGNYLTVRVRRKGEKAYLTIKTRNQGMTRSEWEYPIPAADADEMLAECERKIRKTRYLVPYGGHTWEVDVFHGDLEGLVLAEVELEDESEHVEKPAFVGREVTDDARYYNSALVNSKGRP